MGLLLRNGPVFCRNKNSNPGFGYDAALDTCGIHAVGGTLGRPFTVAWTASVKCRIWRRRQHYPPARSIQPRKTALHEWWLRALIELHNVLPTPLYPGTIPGFRRRENPGVGLEKGRSIPKPCRKAGGCNPQPRTKPAVNTERRWPSVSRQEWEPAIQAKSSDIWQNILRRRGGGGPTPFVVGGCAQGQILGWSHSLSNQ